MWPVLFINLLFLIGIGGVCGYLLIWKTQNNSRLKRLFMYFSLLAASILPVLVHYNLTAQYANHGYEFLLSHESRYGTATVQAARTALGKFMIIVPTGALVLFLFSCWAALRRIPLLSALLPVLAFLLYYKGALAILYQIREPGYLAYLMNNVLTLWVFIMSGVATVLLMGYVWKSLKTSG